MPAYPGALKLLTVPKKAAPDNFIAIAAVEQQDYYSLSSAQKRLYILNRIEPQSTGYNISIFLKLESQLDNARLETTFKELVKRHESFRTSFHLLDDEPVQRVHHDVNFEIQYIDYDKKDLNRFIQPFDLSQAPLLRVVSIDTGQNGRVLLLDMHHIIADGSSMNILIKDFSSLYSGNILPELRIQYKDFSVWRNSREQTALIQRQQDFWLREMSGEIPVLNLPTDFVRPAVQSFDGDSVVFQLDEDETRALKQLGRKNDATLFMVLLGVINVLFYKLSGQDDIVIGTPVAGRGHVDLEPVIGMFVNTLPLRNMVSGETSFTDFLEKLRGKTLEAFENQDYPFEMLVETLDLHRDASRNPLFDVLFVLQNMDGSTLDPDTGLKITPLAHEYKTSKFDLHFNAIETEKGLSITLEYSTCLFRGKTIMRLVNYFKALASGLAEYDRTALEDIEIIGKQEKEEILRMSNVISEDLEIDTIHRLFEQKSEQRENDTALYFRGQTLSYEQLNKKANQLARRLRKMGVKPDTIVGLLADRSMEMVVGILAIMKAGGAYLPIDSDYPDTRKKYMLQDSGLSLLLTNITGTGANDFIPGNIDVLSLNDDDLYREDSRNLEQTVNGSHLLYLIYTSGSTGEPKGIMMEHLCLVNLMKYQFHHTNINFSRVLQFTTISFDVSFQDIFSPLLFGGQLYLIDKETRDFIPGLLEFIGHNEIETLFLPTSFLKFVMNEEEYVRGMPACVRHIVTAGEQLIVNTQFRHYLKENRVWLHNHYGPAETHVVTTLAMDPEGEIPELPSIGKPVMNNSIYILDAKKRLQPIGIPGEIFIAGNQVSRGYLKKELLTAEKFSNNILSTGQRAYRTGDLGRWMPDGNIEFLGRKDFQVKIRGFRVELGEIESQLLSHGDISEAVVILKEEKQGSQRYLCGYFVSTSQLSPSALREYLSDKLPDYMIPSYFVRLEKIPVTPNGKVDQRKLPEPVIDSGETFTAPRNALEEKLLEIWAGVLALEKVKISIDDDFFRLGGHSLKATLLSSRIHKGLNVYVPVTRIFQSPTIRGVAEYIKDADELQFVSLTKAVSRDHYPLSSAQRRLYILQQMSPETTGYNMPTIMKLTGRLNRDRLEDAFLQLTDRHESLRTAFEIVDSQPVQKIYQGVKPEIEYFDYSDDGNMNARLEETVKEFIRPFDLSVCPLLHIGLIKTGQYEYFLAVDLHHIISDGVSNNILMKDFMSFYAGESLPELNLQYKDYSQWLNSPERQESKKQQQKFWLKQFQGELPLLNLPLDHVRPAVQKFDGAMLGFELDEVSTGKLKSLALEQGGTLYIILLTLYMIFLSKVCNQEDVVVGTPVAGRGHADLENIIGVFINTLVLRGYPVAEKTFEQFFEEIKELTLTGFNHQDYPYEDLVNALDIQRDTSRNPLFDTLFALQNMDMVQLEIPGVTMQPYNQKHKIAKFDLSLYAMESGEKLAFFMEYNTTLFKYETVQRFEHYFKATIASVLENKQERLAQIEILPEIEKNQVLYHFNDTSVDYPNDKTIQQVLEEQVRLRGNRCALVCGQSQLTYEDLNRKANQLARMLLDRGVQPDTIVPLIAGRSLEMMIGIFGILKAGAAYLPLDPTYPPERIKYILKDSAASVIITTENLDRLADEEYEILDLNHRRLYRGDDRNLDIPQNPLHLAYAIYTSGSTGKPKGVMIEHRALNNFIKGITDLIRFSVDDTVLSLTTISFDIFGLETILPLTRGSRVIVGNEEEQMDAAVTANTIRSKGVTILQVTPSRLLMLVSHEEAKHYLKCLEYLLVGGEAFPGQLLEKTRQLGVERIYNMYGPTETTIWSAVKDVSTGKELNIGKPIANTGIYILGKGDCLQPVGIAGELLISGDGLARGYVNRPELTAEKFVRLKIDGKLMTLYRTGDLARHLPDGNIEFMGRLDFQVKIRGFRIELGEIENRMLQHEEIKEAVVLAKQNNNGEYQLYAYFVAGRAFTTPEIREFIAGELPDYMIPTYFARVDQMPQTSNGKVDRKTLATYDAEIETGVEYVAPRNGFEEQISKIWKEELGINKVGIHDNFFELGGNSMHIIKISNRLREITNETISVMTMFRYPTIHQLSQYLEQENMEFSFSEERIEESVQMMEDVMSLLIGD